METVTQAAKRWGVSRSCVHLWIRQGLIQAVRLGPMATMIVATDKPTAMRKRGRPRKTPAGAGDRPT